jgi:hypothetical protein
MLLAFAPVSALARHHHRRHHRHARIERFGRDLTSGTTTSSSAENAGTVEDFSGGMLTLMVGGRTITGAVTNDTELECMAPEQGQTIHEDGDSGGGDQSDSGDASGSGDQSGSGEDQNENDAAEQNENDGAQNNCSTADLTHGTVVHEAELRISSAGAVWQKVELGS